MTTQVLVSQNSKRMTRKQFWTSQAGGAITIIAFVVGYALKIDIPPGVEAAAVLVIGNAIGYWVKDRIE